MKNFVRTLVLAATLAGTFSTTAAAQFDEPVVQRSSVAGFHLGVFLNGSAIQLDGSDVTESGGGGSVHLGYGMNENVSVFLRVNAASIQSDEVPAGSYTMAHADVGLRYSFLKASQALRPFVQGAFSGRAVSIDLGSEGVLDARGTGLSAAAGVEYFVSPKVAFEAALSYSFGTFTEGRLDGGEWVDFSDEAFNATSARVDLGVSWHP